MRDGPEGVFRSRRVWVSAVVFMLLPAGGLLAAASGHFSSHGSGFDIRDAYSYWGKSSSPSDGTVIRVAVSDSEFNAELFEESGKPLSRGGGDVGKAYLAYQAAFESRNRKALFPLLDAQGKNSWKKWEKEKKLDGYLDDRWKEKHLELKDAEVTGGFLRGDRAVLFIRGKNSYASLEGEALMRLEDGGWRVHFEFFHLAD